LRATWASYEGHLRHADAFRLRERLWSEHPVSAALLSRRGPAVTRRFALPAPARSYGAQVARLSRGIRRAVLVVQVGAFAEVPRARDAARLGLARRRLGRGRRGAGVPWRAVSGLVRRALGRGLAVAVALEGPAAAGAVRERRLGWLIEPLAAPRGEIVADASGQLFLPGFHVFARPAARAGTEQERAP
jgi:hypothetical protein